MVPNLGCAWRIFFALVLGWREGSESIVYTQETHQTAPSCLNGKHGKYVWLKR